MSNKDWSALVRQLQRGELSRRDFTRQATAAGLSAGAAGMIARQVGAQESSPVAAQADDSNTGAAEPGGRSINREEYYQLVRESFDLSEPEVTGGQVIYAQTTDIGTLNPQLGNDVYSAYINSNVYSFLVETNPVNGYPVPDLADYWELAEDGLTYTFHLNPNAVWHDGNPVTAADVVFSFDTTLDPDSLSPRRSSVELVLESYSAIDDHTVELVAKGPLASFIQDSAGLVGILPKHIWENVPPSEWGSDPGSTGQDPSRVIGSGPFTFVEWVAEDHVTIRRNENYWDPDGVPTIDEFIYRVIPEASAVTAALTTGEIDFSNVPASEANSLKEEPELLIQSYDNLSFNFYFTNQDPARTDLFLDIPVRQALMYALDRELLAEQVYDGYAIQANGTQPVLSPAYAPDRIETIYNYDPEKAAQLLEDAGWVDADGDGIREKDGVKFSFECLYADGVAAYEQQLPYLQQAWGEVGIEMIPTPQPFPSLVDSLEIGEFDMVVVGFTWSSDPGQGTMFRCDSVAPNGFNMQKYCNERYDELDALQRAELDVDTRVDLLIEQSNIVNDEQAAGIMLFLQSIAGSRTTMHNFLPNGYGFLWSMPWWWTEIQN